jgi:hypothetical protein
MSKQISLSQLILNVSKELKIANEESDHAKAPMVFHECELELQVQINSEYGGGFKFHIIEAGAQFSNQSVHTIRVKFSANPNNQMLFGIINPSEGNTNDYPVEKKPGTE